eukprot:TRINITY_DN50128_c0_g1_i1.p1 TRINITY_DN50128_c0_g1~~TRINITY_DN50128_c0_g1_i1.p1  ORF type:complete len:772 (+),score=198.07 TRINITY_DN50128_c0_g1_i1:101-2416(+)
MGPARGERKRQAAPPGAGPPEAAGASEALGDGGGSCSPLELAAAAAVLAVSLGVYGATLHPSVAGGDMGELASVAHDLAVPHPPGYPTLAMLTYAAGEVSQRVFPWVPYGVAQNAFHAALSAAANAALFLAGSRLADSIPAGIVAAGLFGFAPIVWTYATHVEVFSLNNLFINSLELLCVLYWRRRGATPASRFRIVQWGALLCGLALTNQHTSVVYVAPFVLWIVCCDFRLIVLSPWNLLRVTLLFALGLSPYVYLPLSARLNPSHQSWGDCGSWQGFRTHFFREEYGTFSLASKESTYRNQNFARAWRYYLWDCQVQLLGYLWILAVVGILGALWRWVKEHRLRRMEVSTMFALTLALYLNFFNFLCNLPIDRPLFYGVQQRFWIQPLSLVCLLLGLGFAHWADSGRTIARWAGRPAAAPIGSREPVRWSQGMLACLIAVSIAAVQIWTNYDEMDQAGNFVVRDYGRAILGPLPKGAVLLTKGDLMINSARYVQTIDGFRKDVRIVDQEMMTYTWYVTNLKIVYPELRFPGEYYYPNRPNTFDIARLFAANRKKKFFLAHGFKEGDNSWQGKYDAWPFGVIQKVARARGDADVGAALVREFLRETQGALPPPSEFTLPPPGKYASHTWEVVVESDYWQAWHSRSYLLLNWYTKLHEKDPNNLDTGAPQYVALKEAIDGFRTIVNVTHDYPPNGIALRNLGVALQGLGKYHPQDLSIVREMRDAFRSYVQLMQGKLPEQQLQSVREAVTYYDQLLLNDPQEAAERRKRKR